MPKPSTGTIEYIITFAESGYIVAEDYEFPDYQTLYHIFETKEEVLEFLDGKL
jgi:hypothetical protein